ncbi:hypothetical protein [Paenibacillus sp. R14(2021)]|uniref:hypothetical protein n=1 Tax=Paenibacillus sp. R14(2021) TaxID=2859228 RepID=UPI001C61226B|nr:hypothetical protein [Paenibacillus sp. R14(2021)]
MLWKTEYEQEMQLVFNEAEARIGAYPASLNELGLNYLKAFNPLNPAGTKNYICYLLPYWMEPITQLQPEHYRKLSLANVFVMLYFFIQDDLMDTAPEDWKNQLALGNLFQLSMLELYQSLFHHQSPFWSYYRTYVTEWSIAVSSENTGYSHPIDMQQLALKASPVKLASTGALLLAGKLELEQETTCAIDLTLATLQLSDDYSDWEEDFALNTANSLLNMIALEQQSTPAVPMTIVEIKNAIYLNGALNRYAQLAAENCVLSLSLNVSIPHLNAFQAHLRDQLTIEASSIDRNKRLHLDGGFSRLLSTIR